MKLPMRTPEQQTVNTTLSYATSCTKPRYVESILYDVR